jgi:hypothetical protein
MPSAVAPCDAADMIACSLAILSSNVSDPQSQHGFDRISFTARKLFQAAASVVVRTSTLVSISPAEAPGT